MKLESVWYIGNMREENIYISLIRTCKGRNDNDNNGEEVEVDYHSNESMPMQNEKFLLHE